MRPVIESEPRKRQVFTRLPDSQSEGAGRFIRDVPDRVESTVAGQFSTSAMVRRTASIESARSTSEGSRNDSHCVGPIWTRAVKRSATFGNYYATLNPTCRIMKARRKDFAVRSSAR